MSNKILKLEIFWAHAINLHMYILWRMLFYIGWILLLFSQPTILTVSNDSERFLKLVTFTMPNLVFYFYWGMSTFDGEIRNVFWKLRKLLQTSKDLNWLWEKLKSFKYLWILVGQIGEKYKSWTTIKKVCVKHLNTNS